MKNIIVLLCAALAFGFAGLCQAGTISEDFNGGNAAGWFAASPKANYGTGNWRIEDNALRQDLPGDHYKFLLRGVFASSQMVETAIALNEDGYGGITIWYKDADNWVDIFVYPATAGKGFLVVEKVNGSSRIYEYRYSYKKEACCRLKIEANSAAGNIKVYMNDIYLFTHEARTDQRLGSSGLNSGNSGGYFDDFKLTSYDVHGLMAAAEKHQCKKGGWNSFYGQSFENQGQCVSKMASSRKPGKKI